VKTIPLSKARKRAKEIESDVLGRNGGKERDFTNKEVYLILLDELGKKIDKHITWCQEMTEKYIPEFNKQTEVLAHVCAELPDKGFCGKVDKMYQDMYPEGTEEPNVPQKVNLMWNDRRWLKGLLYFLTAIGLGNLLILIAGYLAGRI